MSGRPPEVFRNSLGSSALELGVAAIFVLITDKILTDPGPLGGPTWPNLAVAVGVGIWTIAALVEVVRRLRERVAIEEAGVRFHGDGELIPWSQVFGMRTMGFRGELQLIGQHGEPLGRIPASLGRFGRAVLLIAQGTAARTTSSSTYRGEGSHGARGWVVLAPVIGFIIWEWTFRSAREQDPALLLWVALPLIVPLFHVVRYWRRTGGFDVTVDSAGVRYEGRAGAWSAAWGEIKEIDPDFDEYGTKNKKVLHVHLKSGESHLLPYEGLDLIALVAALRRFGGEAAILFAPPPPAPLLPGR